MNGNDLLKLRELFPSLIPLAGKRPIEKNWQQWCIEPRPFNADDFKKHNVGIPCGPANKVLVLDVDHIVKFSKMCRDQGWKLPETRTHMTGKDKPHYVFGYPCNGHAYHGTSVKDPEKEIDPATGKIITIFDVRGVGGQVVAPGSIHPETGRRYRVHNDSPIAPAPQWLLDLCKQDPIQQAISGVPTPSTNADDSLPISYPVRRLITEGEAKGKRSEAIMSVLNALVRAHLDDQAIVAIFEAYPHGIGQKYFEVGNTREKWLLTQIEKVKRDIEARTPASNFTMADVRVWLESQSVGAKFYNRSAYESFNAVNTDDQKKLRAYLSRAVKEGWARSDPSMVGRFLVSRPIKATDFSKVEDVTQTFVLTLPLFLHESLLLRPGQVVLIAGDTGTGKSTLAYEVASLNYKTTPIQFFIEPGEQKDFEQKRHLLALGVDLAHPNLRVYQKLPGYEAAIEQTQGILIVDYVLPKEDFSDAGNLIKAVTDQVRYGVAFLFTQKHPFWLKPYGGRLAYHHVHHLICMDRIDDGKGEMILAKTQSGGLPIGSRCFYTIENDLHFQPYNPVMFTWDKISLRERWEKPLVGRK